MHTQCKLTSLCLCIAAEAFGDTACTMQPVSLAFRWQVPIICEHNLCLCGPAKCRMASLSVHPYLVLRPVMKVQAVSTMIRVGVSPLIILVNNSGYVIEEEIHAGPYNKISDWNYTAVVEGMAGSRKNLYTAKVHSLTNSCFLIRILFMNSSFDLWF